MKNSKGKTTTKPKRIDWDRMWAQHRTAGFSLEWAAFGGISKRDLAAQCKAQGIPFRWTYTPYVGQYGVEILKRDETKFHKIIGW